MLVGDNAVPQVELFRPDGHTILRWDEEPSPITRAEFDAWRDEQRAAPWAQDQLPQLERAWTALDLPDTKAFYSVAVLGGDGSVWVSRDDPEADVTELRGFSPDGAWVGWAYLPRPSMVMDAGPGWILALVRGEADVEFLHLYRFEG